MLLSTTAGVFLSAASTERLGEVKVDSRRSYQQTEEKCEVSSFHILTLIVYVR